MGRTVAELVAKLSADTSDFTAGMVKASSSTSDFQKSAGMSMDTVGRKMTHAGTTMTAALTVPIVAGLAVAVKSFGNFEQTLNVFQATSDATGSEMKAVGELAKKLGNDLTLPGTSAADAATSMTELAKGGFTVQESMDAVTGVLRLSAAAQIGNARAAEICSSAINAFNLKAKDAARVTDLLAGAANASSASIEDVADAMQQAAAVYSAAGVPIEDLTTAIGLMANAGIKGSDAGTSLKTMLMSLTAPSTKAAETLASMGISIYDAHGAMIPFRDIIEKFTPVLASMTQEQRNAAMAAIFGTDAVRAGNIIMGEGAAAWDEMNAAVTEAGTAQKLAEAQTKGFNGTMDAMKSSLETMAISIGPILVPALEKLAGAVASAATWFAEMGTVGKTASLAVLLIVAAIGPLVLIIGKFATAWAALNVALAGSSISAGALVGTFGKVSLVLTALLAHVAIWAPKMTDAEEATTLFSDALKEIGPASDEAVRGIVATTIAEKELGPKLREAGLTAADFFRAVLSGAGALDDGRRAAAEFNNKLVDLQVAGKITGETVTELTGIQGDLSWTYMENKKTADELRGATGELESGVGALTETGRKAIPAVQEITDWAKDAAETFTAASDPMKRFAADSEVTMGTLKTNLAGNIRDLEGWANNLKLLAQRGFNDLAMEMFNLGPNAALAVGQATKMSDPKLTELQTLFAQKGKLTGTDYTMSLEAALRGVVPATDGIAAAINSVPKQTSVTVTVVIPQSTRDAINYMRSSLSSVSNFPSLVSSPTPLMASGGPINGMAWVGEEGPELFVGHGTIIPNDTATKMTTSGSAVSSAGGVVNNYLTIEVSALTSLGVPEAVITAIKEYERRNGTDWRVA